jgi:hypothetical protein
VEARRQTLLRGGVMALDLEWAQEERRLRSAAKRRALAALRDYLAPHGSHSGYAERLCPGQSIGSGMVEGACKTVVGKRLKQTGTRWRVRRAERLVALCGLLYSDLWYEYWRPSKN